MLNYKILFQNLLQSMQASGSNLILLEYSSVEQIFIPVLMKSFADEHHQLMILHQPYLFPTKIKKRNIKTFL